MRKTDKQETIEFPIEIKNTRNLYIYFLDWTLKDIKTTEFLRINSLKIFERNCKNWPLNCKIFCLKNKYLNFFLNFYFEQLADEVFDRNLVSSSVKFYGKNYISYLC